jgi:type I restriction enzyme, S subunit
MSEPARRNVCTLADLVVPIDIKISSRKDPARPYVGLENIPSRGADLLGWEPASASISTNSVFAPGDILFGKLRPNLRKSVLASFDGYCSTDILVLRAREGIHAGFAGKVFQTERVGAAAEKTAIGTKMPRTSWKHLSALEVFCPAFAEQERIARVLDTLDIAIRETEAIVAKLKAVKQGLLQDLLTRGIGANGELRPPQSEDPGLYKQSALGWIPGEWAVVRVGDEADIEHGFAFPGAAFTADPVGPALLVPGNFHREGGLYFTSENTKFFAGKYPRNTLLNNGDVLIVMTDLSPMTLILGRTVVLNEPFAVLHNQRIGKFRFRSQDSWDSGFFAAVMNQDRTRRRVIAEASGTTVRHTSPDRIKSYFVARPGVAEQREAMRRLYAMTARERTETLNALKLRQTKLGVMDDLLTRPRPRHAVTERR